MVQGWGGGPGAGCRWWRTRPSRAYAVVALSPAGSQLSLCSSAVPLKEPPSLLAPGRPGRPGPPRSPPPPEVSEWSVAPDKVVMRRE